MAGAAIGHALGDAIRASATFNACMRESGFVPETREVMATIQDKHAQISKITADRVQCLATVRQSAQFTVLGQHFPDPSTGHYSMSELANQQQPDPTETAILPTYFDAISVCRAQSAAAISPLVPGAGEIFVAAEQRYQENALNLLHHKLTWGDFAQGQQAIQTDIASQLRHLSLL